MSDHLFGDDYWDEYRKPYTTSEVRDHFASGVLEVTHGYVGDDETGPLFDAWLAANNAEAAAKALEDAAEEFRMGQLTGAFTSREGYTQAWLRRRAEVIREGEGG